MGSLVATILAMAVILRVVPNLIAPYARAVDHWYWKAYIEAYRRDGTFPPKLPQYVLDESQWYPPLFPLLLAHLPTKVLDDLGLWLAVTIDVVRLVILLGVAAWLGGGDPWVIGATGVAYATTPVLISYNTQLNPRGVAALLLDAVAVIVLWQYVSGYRWSTWLSIVTLAGLLLLTHKMTAQLFWILALAA